MGARRCLRRRFGPTADGLLVDAGHPGFPVSGLAAYKLLPRWGETSHIHGEDIIPTGIRKSFPQISRRQSSMQYFLPTRTMAIPAYMRDIFQSRSRSYTPLPAEVELDKDLIIQSGQLRRRVRISAAVSLLLTTLLCLVSIRLWQLSFRGAETHTCHTSNGSFPGLPRAPECEIFTCSLDSTETLV